MAVKPVGALGATAATAILPLIPLYQHEKDATTVDEKEMLPEIPAGGVHKKLTVGPFKAAFVCVTPMEAA